MLINVITNGLLLTPEVVDRLAPYGLNGVKITLDGDHDTHNRMRPLRGGQGTFDKIIENVRARRRQVPHLDRRQLRRDLGRQLSGAARLPAEQDFADKLARVAFKPVIREPKPQQPKGMIPLTVVGSERQAAERHVHDVGRQRRQPASATRCNFLDEKMSFLREETKKRGFSTIDGVHMGPCEIHREHAHTIGPDGALYACPGFTGDAKQSTGHIDGRQDERRAARGARGSSSWRRGRSATTAPSSRSAPAAARSRRTPNSAT